MSTYKKLNKQDAYITTYTARKSWAVSGSDFADYGIEVITATGSYLTSLQQLYYPNKSAGEITSHSYDYYNQTTLYFSESRNLTTGSIIYSIPRDLFGVYMQPEIRIEGTSSEPTRYVSDSYWSTDYISEQLTPVVLGSIYMQDDGEGNLYISGSSPQNNIGDIIYTHGMVIVTDPEYISILANNPTKVLAFQSNLPIFTHNYHCRIRESEYNFTHNPSVTSGSIKPIYDNDGMLYTTTGSVNDGVLKNNVTGSSFQPYITTVGLYNDANELIAVGKMSQPVPKPANTEMTIIVKIDI
jgi:hypothetical protein